jgi:hypothetical protein
MDKGQILRRGRWQVAYKAINVLCSDGVRRTVDHLKEPNTFFSIPGSVQVKGRTVAGYIMSRDDDLIFSAFLYRANGKLLPNIPVSEYKDA